MKAYVAGNILLLEGVFALFSGYVIYDETFSISQSIGVALILISAIIISTIDHKVENAIPVEG